jgi:hypothetical protein
MLDTVCDATKTYAAATGGIEADISVDRLLHFHAIKIIKGVVGINSIRRAWSQHPAHRNLLISSIMSRNDFLYIHRWLHLPESSKLDESGNIDFFHKIAPFASKFDEQCRNNWDPSQVCASITGFYVTDVLYGAPYLRQDLAADESTVGSAHRTLIVERTPHKKVASGVDIKSLCDVKGAYLYTFLFAKVRSFVPRSPFHRRRWRR